MIKFTLHRNKTKYQIFASEVLIHTFKENEEVKAVEYAKNYISSWQGTLILGFKSDYTVNL